MGMLQTLPLLMIKADCLHCIDRFFPSTKLCMDCGQIHEMPLSKRIFECYCGVDPIDRDLHTSQNTLLQGLSEVKPVEMEALANSNIVSETTVNEAGNTHKGCRKDNHYNFL